MAPPAVSNPKRRRTDSTPEEHMPSAKRLDVEHGCPFPLKHEYSIGWICALPIEMAAANIVLDEEYQWHDNECQDPEDGNSYQLGRIGKHNIVIACLPEYGTNPAAIVAKDMLRTFTAIKIGLMVGIGAGIPTKDNDIRLGDVVVSKPEGEFGGVVQWDRGKTNGGGLFEHTGSMNKPPAVLLAARARLHSQHIRRGNNIFQTIQAILHKEPHLRTEHFDYQGLNHDNLFAQCTIHVSQVESCSLCNKIIDRPVRSNCHPVVHYGIIASGNQVIKGFKERDKLGASFGAKCVEMEAAGLMDNFPCLVIRGISDYGDSRKNKIWQPYAAFTAAAYAKELLGLVQHSQLRQTPDIIHALNSVVSRLETIETDIKQTVTKHWLEKISRWLSSPDPSVNYNKTIGDRHPHTGEWLLKDESFRDWICGKKRFLALQGPPGCGKTTLMSAVIQRLLTPRFNPSSTVLYFFFDFNDEKKQSLNGLLRSLLMQLYCKNEKCQGLLQSLFSSRDHGQMQPDLDSMVLTFDTMLKVAGQTHIVLDALDECGSQGAGINERQKVGSWIENILESLPNCVSIIASSRLGSHGLPRASGSTKALNVVRVQKKSVDIDIQTYIHTRLDEDDSLKRWRDQLQVRAQIESKLMDKADGMFRWAVCQLDSLQYCATPRSLQAMLDSLPRSLNETYARILKNVPRESRQEVITLLNLLTWSHRPLDMWEARDAIAVDFSAEAAFHPNNRMPSAREVLSLCPNLVIPTLNKSGTPCVQLAHLSVKDYLVSDRTKDVLDGRLMPTKARANIAKIYLAYLSYVHRNAPIITIPYRELCFAYPLTRICDQDWEDHARQAELSDKSVVKYIVEYLASRCRKLKDEHPIPDPLFTAAACGLGCTVKFLLDIGFNPDSHGYYGGNAVQMALFNGFDDVAQHLIDRGANINAMTELSGNALHAACSSGDEKIVLKLLDKGVDPDQQIGFHGTAIQVASATGKHGVVQLLCQKGVDVNAIGGIHGNALQAASRWGHKEVVRVLLAYKADIEMRDRFTSFTPLMEAIRHGHLSIVKMLLARGANVHAKGRIYHREDSPNLKVPYTISAIDLAERAMGWNIKNSSWLQWSEVSPTYTSWAMLKSLAFRYRSSKNASSSFLEQPRGD